MNDTVYQQLEGLVAMNPFTHFSRSLVPLSLYARVRVRVRVRVGVGAHFFA